jgi:hypothetical protein
MPKKKPNGAQQLTGQVVSFNISPKGHVEGALLDVDGATIQVNFSKHEAESLARSLKVGAVASLNAELETDEYDHPVYIAHGGSEGPVRGSIVRLNYALHGEVNGFHLDDGTFVHLKPEGAAEFGPKIGEVVSATGQRKAGADCPVLEAEVVEREGRPRKPRRHA